MTQFERTFIMDSLNHLEVILSDSNALAAAVQHYSEGKTSDTRYFRNSRINDVAHWTDDEVLKFNAAVFDATFLATLPHTSSDDLSKQISKANDLFRTEYIPLLTADTIPDNRLASVQKNLTRIKSDLQSGIEPIINNPYVFFPAVVAGLAVVAVTYAFTK